MPQAIAGALVSAFGSAAFGWGAAYTIAYTVVIAGTVEYNKAQRRKAEARARAAANASAKDREVMIRSAVAPRRIIYGRDRVSGPIVYMESTGDKSQYLHLVVALAAHECDAIETIFFNEVALPTEDGSGYITSGEFRKGGSTAQTVHSGTTNGSGSITLPHNALSIVAAFSETGTGENYSQTQHSYTHTAGSNTVTGLPASTQVTIGYTYEDGAKSVVRIKRHLGSPTQTADADLVSESGGNWTSDHRGRGICYLYVRLEYDQEIFGGVGIPNISAVVRGKKVYDPRTATTAWSDNAALCIADWLRSAEGMRAASAEVPDSEISAAANICDETVTLNLAGTETQKRYTINSSWTSEQSPRDVLADMCQCMGGRAVWTQGRWLVRPGAYRTPTVTITADMLAGPISIAPRASRSELFNAVRVLHRDAAQQYAEVQAPLVLNSGYEADDGGVRIVRQIDLPTLADTYRAQRIGKLELERARQALTVKLQCNLQAYDLAPTDTVLLTLATYGWSSKPFEVLDRTLSTEGTIQYTLRETAAGVYDWNYGEATVGDLAPNTDLPSPFWRPPVVSGFSVAERAVRMGDGTIVTQAVFSWAQSTSAFVLSGGRIELQVARADSAYTSILLPGDAQSTVYQPLQVGMAYVGRIRAVSAAGVAGDWAYRDFVSLGLAAPPADVTGLDAIIKPSQVWVTWDACPDADYSHTVLRTGGTGWSDATFLAKISGTDYKHPRPPDGSYTVRAKHVDRSGVASTNAASKSISISAGAIDPAAVARVVLSSDAVAFAFPSSGGLSTATPPKIVFSASLEGGISGSVTWSAQAYRADGTLLGSVTLANQTATTAELTKGDFVGSYGDDARSVVVSAMHSGSGTYDTQRVVRVDSGSNAITAALTNSAHGIPTDAAGGSPNYTGSGTEIHVWDGAVELQYDGTGTADGTWKVTAYGSQITPGSITDGGAYAVVGDHSAITGDTASINFKIQGKRLDGSTFSTFDAYQRLFKVPAGAAGAAGPAGDGLETEFSVDGATGWHSTFVAGDLYARWRVGSGSWYGPWKIVGEDGSAGDYTDFIFRRAATQPATPSGDNPSGWYDAPPAGSDPLWVAVATKRADGTVLYGWSTPSQLSGPKGDAGDTGRSNHRVYRAASIASPPSTPAPTISGATPSGWSATPVSLSTGEAQWQSDGVTPAGSTTTTWGAPYQSYVKVGSLDAISANLGTITAGTVSGVQFVVKDAGGGSPGGIDLIDTSSTLRGRIDLWGHEPSMRSVTAGQSVWLQPTSYSEGWCGLSVGAVSNGGLRVWFYPPSLADANNKDVYISSNFPIHYRGENLVRISGGFRGVLASSELILSGASRHLRFIPYDNSSSSYGLMMRNDGTDFYMLLTDNNDAFGLWNSLRPFQLALSSGAVTCHLKAVTGGNVTASGSKTATYNTAFPGASNQTNKWWQLTIDGVPYAIPIFQLS